MGRQDRLGEAGQTGGGPLQGVRSPLQDPHQTRGLGGGESAPLIRVRSVVRVHEGPPYQSYQAVSQLQGPCALLEVRAPADLFDCAHR